MNRKLRFDLEKIIELRCGRNEHQAAALYSEDEDMLRQRQGDSLEYCDLINMDVAANIVSDVLEKAFAIVHMANPIYVCYNKPYLKHLDKIDLTHTVIASNAEFRSGTIQHCIDSGNMPSCIVAPTFESYALDLAKTLPQLKLVTVNVKQLPFVDLKMTRWGVIAQEEDNLSETLAGDKRLAWAIIKYAKSYAIAFVKDGETVVIKHSLHKPTDIFAGIEKPHDCTVATDYPFKNSNETLSLIYGQKQLLFPGMYFEGKKPANFTFMRFGHLKIT